MSKDTTKKTDKATLIVDAATHAAVKTTAAKRGESMPVTAIALINKGLEGEQE